MHVSLKAWREEAYVLQEALHNAKASNMDGPQENISKTMDLARKHFENHGHRKKNVLDLARQLFQKPWDALGSTGRVWHPLSEVFSNKGSVFPSSWVGGLALFNNCWASSCDHGPTPYQHVVLSTGKF